MVHLGTEIANRTVGLLLGAHGPPKAIRELLEKHGEERIVSITVCRTPLSNWIKKTLSFLSLGKPLAYDQIFHLYMFIHTDRGTSFTLDKDEIVKVRYVSHPQRTDTECKQVPMRRRVSVAQLIGNAWKARGSHLWHYSAFSDNCQRYVHDLLQYSGLLTPDVSRFVLQDVKVIASTLLPGTSAAANAVTGLAARLRTALLGQGLRSRSHTRPRPMSSRKWISSAIKHPGALRRVAAQQGAITQRGTISKTWLRAHQHAPGVLGKRVRLALTLRRLPHRRRGGSAAPASMFSRRAPRLHRASAADRFPHIPRARVSSAWLKSLKGVPVHRRRVSYARKARKGRGFLDSLKKAFEVGKKVYEVGKKVYEHPITQQIAIPYAKEHVIPGLRKRLGVGVRRHRRRGGNLESHLRLLTPLPSRGHMPVFAHMSDNYD
jgi:hypothetical protein